MKYFRDPTSGEIYGLNDDVNVSGTEGNYTFVSPCGTLRLPACLSAYAGPIPPPLPPLTLPQQAQALLSGGMTVTSTSGGWTATFPVITDRTGTNVWTMVLSELAALNLSGNAAFADGEAVVQWPDAAGELRQMTPERFQAFARVMGAFVARCRNVITGAAADLPAAAATIL